MKECDKDAGGERSFGAGAAVVVVRLSRVGGYPSPSSEMSTICTSCWSEAGPAWKADSMAVVPDDIDVLRGGIERLRGGRVKGL